jgi:hypothetical protein
VTTNNVSEENEKTNILLRIRYFGKLKKPKNLKRKGRNKVNKLQKVGINTVVKDKITHKNENLNAVIFFFIIQLKRYDII